MTETTEKIMDLSRLSEVFRESPISVADFIGQTIEWDKKTEVSGDIAFSEGDMRTPVMKLRERARVIPEIYAMLQAGCVPNGIGRRPLGEIPHGLVEEFRIAAKRAKRWLRTEDDRALDGLLSPIIELAGFNDNPSRRVRGNFYEEIMKKYFPKPGQPTTRV